MSKEQKKDTVNIFKQLREDHAHQRRLLDNILETSGDSRARRGLFADLRKSMSDHAACEERHLYNPMIKHDMTQKHARHSIAEHHEMDVLVDELDNIEMSSSAWLTRFNRLQHLLLHHLEEEEKEIFPVAGKVLSAQEKQQLGRDYENDMLARH